MTAYEIIKEIEKLPLKEKQIVVDYLDSMEDVFQQTHYSVEDMAKLDQAQEEAHNGINVSPEMDEEEAIEYLRKLRQQ